MLIRAAHAETRLTDEEVIPKKPGRAFRVCGSPGGFFTAKQEGRQGGESYQMVGMVRRRRPKPQA